MPGQTVTLRLAKENMKFSAGHFTIFGPGERERVHGHDFRVAVRVQARVGDNGLCFDYGLLKRRIVELCRELNEWMLLPGESPLLRIERDGALLHAVFGAERIPFLAADVQVLPLANISVEELARYFLGRLLEDRAQVDAFRIDALDVEVASGPGQGATVSWQRAG
ncbi:MAG TPA: 6-carboxytetrahydropterin synthase [Rhodanobacter sp.]|nr:6-carboxytetrahydropterin synthase [Rhodanobacter sp.]